MQDAVRTCKLLRLSRSATSSMQRLFVGCEEQDGRHSFESFQAAVCSNQLAAMRNVILQLRTMKDMFDVFDRQMTGRITADDLGRTLTQLLGWRPTRYESEKLLATVDEDDDKYIIFREFVIMLQNTSIPVLTRIKSELSNLMETYLMFESGHQSLTIHSLLAHSSPHSRLLGIGTQYWLLQTISRQSQTFESNSPALVKSCVRLERCSTHSVCTQYPLTVGAVGLRRV